MKHYIKFCSTLKRFLFQYFLSGYSNKREKRSPKFGKGSSLPIARCRLVSAIFAFLKH